MKKLKVCLLTLLCLAALPVNAMALNAVYIAEDAVKALSKAPSSIVIQSKLSPALITQLEEIGGKSMVAKAEKIATMHGASALKVLANNPRLIPALERFGFRDQSKLLNALSHKPGLAKAVRKYGDDVLKLELRSNGQAMKIVGTFGGGGLKLADKLTAKQLGVLAVESSRFRQASASVIKDFLDTVGKYTGKVFDWLEKHPRILYTATGAALVVDMKTELLGDPETGTQGAVQQIAKSGFKMGGDVLKVFAPWWAGVLLILGLFRSWLNRPRKPKAKQQRSSFFWQNILARMSKRQPGVIGHG